MTPALLLCLLLPAQGRSCLTQSTYRVQARAQTYATQSYAQNYVQPTYQIRERLIWVPVEGGSSYPDSAYSAADLVGSRQRSQAQAAGRVAYQQALIDQIAGNRAELAGIRAELAKANQNATDPGPPIPPTGPPVGPPTQPPPDPNQPPPAPKPEVDPAVAAQWTNDAIAVLNARCLKCHGGDEPKKGFRIFAPDGKLALQSPASLALIKSKVDTLKMPPAKPLSEEEAAKIGLWVGLHDDEIADFIRELLKAGPAKAPASPLPASAPPPPIVPPPNPQPERIKQ